MDFDISQTLGFLGKAFKSFLDCFLFVSGAINDHSATITIGISLSAVVTWLLYRHRTKRRLKVDVNLNPNASESFKKSGKITISDTWDVFLINPGYHTVYIEEVGLLYQDWRLGESKEFPILQVGGTLEISPGNKIYLSSLYMHTNTDSCPREILGAYAKDKTGKVWRIRKRLKIEEGQ